MLTPGARGWVGVAAALAAAAGLLATAEPAAFDWQPGLAAAEPWRWLSAAAVHYSALHLAANLAGAALVAALGVVARVAPASSWAWAAALPLTHLGLLARPDLLHYGGLSGVLHAGVAVAAIELILARGPTRRWIGFALLAGLVVKVLSETPWGPALRHPAGWDIATAPFAHASGLVAGLACAGLARWLRRPAARPATPGTSTTLGH